MSYMNPHLTPHPTESSVEYDSHVMEAVMDKFLENPAIFSSTNHYVVFQNLKRDFPDVNADVATLRWHVAAFLGEYVVASDIFVSELMSRGKLPTFQNTENYLNRSGKALLEEFRNPTKNDIQQE